ncbi:MAG: thioredoxin domain-containing protein, partial [Planctomycetes bacterium]|nr:thioredoxin domain-containing protein [Planctomycetota bacterium]
ELLARLRLVSEYYGQNREAVRQRLVDEARARRTPQTEPTRPALAALGRPKVELSLEVVEHVTRTILQTADPVHGGWGSQHKFPHPEAIDFALVRWSQTGDPELLQLVRRTLRNMQDGEIHDRVEGGFYRYATRPDWSVPHHEKMLDSNAQRLFAYLDAYQALGEDSFRATAEGVLRWMTSTLLDPETQAFRGSQDADPTYARLASPEARQRHGAPPCDPTVFSNWN